ncbi:uncharacterized protein LOC123872098 [Maniola jurtina]|uniref:uncharacterized protein LOC123872098 n=1 Tax=Maniola jurtina TaxID=191418 RepID=UPI001E68E7BE|nr:uncharacterized protein LOC123872098 [Maniola jurtina]
MNANFLAGGAPVGRAPPRAELQRSRLHGCETRAHRGVPRLRHAEDSAQHTLDSCVEWSTQRAALVTEVGLDLSLPAVIRAMVSSDRSWNAVASFCEEVMTQEEAAERRREADANVDPIRRRRTGRRRHAQDCCDTFPNTILELYT